MADKDTVMRRQAMCSWPIAMVIVIGWTGIVLAQDVVAGQKSFVKCSPCHAIGPGAQNKIGPIQNGLDGRKAGTIPGYSYSDANKNSGIVWNETTFNEVVPVV